MGGLATNIAIYLTIWWTVLFCILPIGQVSHLEAGVDPCGGDPGAPVNPNLVRKCITTTWVSALVHLALWALIAFHVINLSAGPWRT
jgi:predicted secreted protein